jgi:hypothetical protein
LARQRAGVEPPIREREASGTGGRVVAAIAARPRRGRLVPKEVYEDHGIRFLYPSDWEIEVKDEGDVATIDVQHPSGTAFLLVRTDEACPDPDEVADSALAAMREEYPDLDAVPVVETLDEHNVTGHDVEFFSLDFSNAALIRCFRTPRHTVLIFGQWSDFGEGEAPELVAEMIRSLAETEA